MDDSSSFSRVRYLFRAKTLTLAVAVLVGILLGLASVALATTSGVPAAASTAATSEATYYKAVDAWGSRGTGDGQFDAQSGIAADSSGNVYVTDEGNYRGDNARVQKFSSDGTFLTKWGSTGAGDGQFYYPHGVAVDSQGNVYVADTLNHRVQKFSSNGTFLKKWGSTGAGDGQFSQPKGVAVDSQGNVYVADTDNNRVQKFSSDGTFLKKWGSFGEANGQFSFPDGVAVDSQGNVYVADTLNHRVQKFSSDGTFLKKWGSTGAGDGQFYYPDGVAVDSQGNVYVADEFNDRVQKFSSDGTFLTKWGSTGAGDGQFSQPKGVAVDSQGNVYVTDTYNARVQKFSEVPLSTDVTAPVTRATLSPSTYANSGFTNRDTTVYLDASDINGSGTKKVTYQASGARQIAPTTVKGESVKFTIRAVGKTTVSFYSTDRAGNVEQPEKSVSVTIDRTRPRVSSTTPKNLATGIRPGTPVKAVFSERIRDERLIQYSLMKLKLYKQGSSVRVGAQLSYDRQAKTATLVPDAPLTRGATYRVEVSTYNRDWAGNRLDQKPNVTGRQPKVWFFTVAN